MVVKQIIALKNVMINTGIEKVHLIPNETYNMKFQSEPQFQALLAFGNFKEHFSEVPVLPPRQEEPSADVDSEPKRQKVNHPPVVEEIPPTRDVRPEAVTEVIPPLRDEASEQEDDQKSEDDQKPRRRRRRRKAEETTEELPTREPKVKLQEPTIKLEVAKRGCENCNNEMVCVGQSNVDGLLKTKMLCPVCGETGVITVDPNQT